MEGYVQSRRAVGCPICVREYEFGHSVKNDDFRIRIELLAVSKTPPVGQGLVTTMGVKRD